MSRPHGKYLGMSKRNAGFSLVEVLVSIAVLMFILAGSAVTLRLHETGRVKQHDDWQNYQELQSVREKIIYEAGTGRFERMTETDADRTPLGMESKFRITSTIGPMSPNQTRDVTLTITRQTDQGEKTKTLTFSVSKTSSRVSGAFIKVRIVSALNPSEGVAGILLTCAGHDNSEVSATTDENGLAILSGVKLNKDGVSFLADGSPALAYFDGNVLTKTFQTTETKSGDTESTYFRTPITVSPPAKLQGRVTDSETGAPVPNYKILVQGAYHTNDMSPTVITDADGKYSVNLMSGPYYYFLLGNGIYTGEGTPSDPANRYSSAPTDFTVSQGQTMVKNFDVLRRGSFRAQVKGITFANGMLETDGPVSSGVAFKLFRDTINVYQHPSGTSSNMGYTQAMSPFHWMETYGKGMKDMASTDASGIIQIDTFAPLVLDRRFPRGDQYIKGYIRPNVAYAEQTDQNLSPAFSYVPVMVWGPTAAPPWSLDDAKLFAYPMGGNLDSLVSGGEVFPQGTDVSRFDVRLFANGLDSPNAQGNQKDQTLYILKHDVLSNIAGKVYSTPSGGPSVPYPAVGSIILTREDGTFRGCASLVYWEGVTYVTSARKNEEGTTGCVVNSVIQSGENEFRFGESTLRHANQVPMPILPSVGGEKAKLLFNARHAQSLPFQLTVNGWTKVADTGADSDYQLLPASQVDVSGMKLRMFPVGISSPGLNTTVDVIDGEVLTNKTAYAGFQVLTPAFSIPPAQTVDVDIHVTGEEPVTYATMNLIYEGQTGDEWRAASFPFDPTCSAYKFYDFNTASGRYLGEPFHLLKRAATGSIYGLVTDAATHEPIVGATVRVWNSYTNQWADVTQTVANTGPGGYHQYELSNIPFWPFKQDNVKIEIVHTDYEPKTYKMSGYDGVTKQVDFQLLKNGSPTVDIDDDGTGGL